MERAKKHEVVADLHGALREAALVVVTQQSGMTVAESTDLRRAMREAGANFKVTKNRLARIAIKGTPFEGLDPYFKGPTAIAFTQSDAVAVAKAITAYAKGNDKVEIIGGGLGQQVIDEKGVEALAKMPSIDELRAKLLGVLVAPMSKTAGVMQAPARELLGMVPAAGSTLARVIQAYSQKQDAA